LLTSLVSALICGQILLFLLDRFHADDNWFWKGLNGAALPAFVGIASSFVFKIWRTGVSDNVQVFTILTILALPLANFVLTVLFLCFVRGVCI
jgi:hypothetical protein